MEIIQLETLTKYAKRHGIGYRAAWNRFRLDKIPGAVKDEFGKILVPEETINKPIKVACYARVSSSSNRSNLDSQMNRIVEFTNSRGLQVHSQIKEVGSGLNDRRPKLLKMMDDPSFTHIIVENRDRLTRFGFEYLKMMARHNGAEIIVLNTVDNDRDDLMLDFVSLVTSFCSRLYGLRRSGKTTKKLIESIENDTINAD